MEFGHHAQLLAHGLPQLPPQVTGVVAHVCERGLLVLHREEAHVHPGHAQVGADPHAGDGDHGPGKQATALLLEDGAELLLEQAVHLVLSEAVHVGAQPRR